MSRTMMFRYPSINKTSGSGFGISKIGKYECDYLVVDSSEIQEKEKEGYFLKSLDAIDSKKDSKKSEYRLKLEAMAKQLGVKFSHNTRDETLHKNVEEAVAKAK